MKRSILLVSLAFTLEHDTKAAEEPQAKDHACMAATGETIHHPWSKATYTVGDDEQRVEVPVSMVYVPAGKFTMGERESAHEVSLDGFCIGKYEVTNAEWKEFLDDTGSRARPRYWREGKIPAGKENHPLLFVSWNDAQKYCEWVSRKTGWAVSLPTEAQWEKAARGGTKEYLFPWGNDRETENCNYCGYCASKNGVPTDRNGEVSGWREFTKTEQYRAIMATGGFTTPVGTFPGGKSFYGAHDMAGNAFEWCLDWYKGDYYKLDGAGVNPKGPSEREAEEVNKAQERGKNKVIRGGSWYSHFSSCLTTSRREVRNPKMGYHSVGFRIVATVTRPVSAP
jgi:formylglycine-generating enzyme required for sulfatase activity